MFCDVTWWNRGSLDVSASSFVPYVFTRPVFQCRGYAGSLIVRAAKVLADQGVSELDLVATVGGPGERLYERLGFLDVMQVL